MNAVRAVFEDRVAGNRNVQYDVRAGESASPLQAIMSVARQALGRIRADAAGVAPVFVKGRVALGSTTPSPSALADQLLQRHPIRVEPGFEGNAGIAGGVWRDDADDDNALVYLCFSEGTVDLPLHVHELSDRFIAIAAGFGLFHYMPEGASCNELRSVVVQAGDVVVLTRGLVHTFTAPVADLVLLSYHAPYFEFEDPRQFTITEVSIRNGYGWIPASIQTRMQSEAAIKLASAA